MHPDDEPDPAETAPESQPESPSEPTPAGPFYARGLDVLHPDDVEDDDPDDGGEYDLDEDDDDENDVRTVLITGASGNIGRKLAAAWKDVYDLVLIDTDEDPANDVIQADLADPVEGWLTHFHGVDAVVHLAGNPDPEADWGDVQGPNLDGVANVLHAAALTGVERVVFASSNHVMGGYKGVGDGPITADLPPKPDGAYGASKLMGERLGQSLSRVFDLSFVALRIGANLDGENDPSAITDDWDRRLWLSDRDLVRLFDCAIEADLEGRPFVVVNGTSRNQGSRWDLGPAAELLGYEPEDDAYAERT